MLWVYTHDKRRPRNRDDRSVDLVNMLEECWRSFQSKSVPSADQKHQRWRRLHGFVVYLLVLILWSYYTVGLCGVGLLPGWQVYHQAPCNVLEAHNKCRKIAGIPFESQSASKFYPSEYGPRVCFLLLLCSASVACCLASIGLSAIPHT